MADNTPFEKYHSTEDPYTLVQAVHGTSTLERLSKLAGVLEIRNGKPYVREYTDGNRRLVEVTRDSVLLRDRNGLRVMGDTEFDRLFGDPLSYREIQRWSNASRPKSVPEPVRPHKIDLPEKICTGVRADDEAGLIEKALAKGRECFGEDAELRVEFASDVIESSHLDEGQWYCSVKIHRRG